MAQQRWERDLALLFEEDPPTETITETEATDVQVLVPGQVYSELPHFKPKYRNGRWQDTFGTLARMYVPFGSDKAYQNYIDSVGQQAKSYAKALAITGGPETRGLGAGYFDFGLQAANESYQEKMQVTEVVSDAYVAYFFGQRAPVWSYSGFFLNTNYDEWYDAFHILYEDVLRGTRLADRKVEVRMQYDTRTVTGVLTGMTTTVNAQNELFAGFQFQMLVSKVIYSPTRRDPTLVEQITYGDRTDAELPGLLRRTRAIAMRTLGGAKVDLSTSLDVLSNLRPGADTSELYGAEFLDGALADLDRADATTGTSTPADATTFVDDSASLDPTGLKQAEAKISELGKMELYDAGEGTPVDVLPAQQAVNSAVGTANAEAARSQATSKDAPAAGVNDVNDQAVVVSLDEDGNVSSVTTIPYVDVFNSEDTPANQDDIIF